MIVFCLILGAFVTYIVISAFFVDPKDVTLVKESKQSLENKRAKESLHRRLNYGGRIVDKQFLTLRRITAVLTCCFGILILDYYIPAKVYEISPPSVDISNSKLNVIDLKSVVFDNYEMLNLELGFLEKKDKVVLEKSSLFGVSMFVQKYSHDGAIHEIELPQSPYRYVFLIISCFLIFGFTLTRRDNFNFTLSFYAGAFVVAILCSFWVIQYMGSDSYNGNVFTSLFWACLGCFFSLIGLDLLKEYFFLKRNYKKTKGNVVRFVEGFSKEYHKNSGFKEIKVPISVIEYKTEQGVFLVKSIKKTFDKVGTIKEIIYDDSNHNLARLDNFIELEILPFLTFFIGLFFSIGALISFFFI